MSTALPRPLDPQLARPQETLPEGADWRFEPKLDGFRAIVFVDGASHQVQSRNGRLLDRYFPELEFPPGHYVMDGELIVPGPDGEADFEVLQERIHPAESRVRMLADRSPARFVAFDLLEQDGTALLDRTFDERRRLLEAAVSPPVQLIDQTDDPERAGAWLAHGEGVVAKRADAPYRPGERTPAMVKIKRRRTIDCVAMGWRPATSGDRVGSIVIGLYREDGGLIPVGHCAGFTARRARELLDVLRPLETGESGEGPPNRWSQGRNTTVRMLRPELVCEVSYDHASGGRIRHGARLLRLRDDKPPTACTADQLN